MPASRSGCVYKPRTNKDIKTKRTSATNRIASIGLACGLLWSAGTAGALAQTAPPSEVPATLNAIDFNFVGQANLGRTAALFKKPSQALEDAINHGRLAAVTAQGFTEMQGGLPIVVDGEVIGAIGASFDTPEHDVQIAQAGLAAVPH